MSARDSQAAVYAWRILPWASSLCLLLSLTSLSAAYLRDSSACPSAQERACSLSHLAITSPEGSAEATASLSYRPLVPPVERPCDAPGRRVLTPITAGPGLAGTQADYERNLRMREQALDERDNFVGFEPSEEDWVSTVFKPMHLCREMAKVEGLEEKVTHGWWVCLDQYHKRQSATHVSPRHPPQNTTLHAHHDSLQDPTTHGAPTASKGSLLQGRDLEAVEEILGSCQGTQLGSPVAKCAGPLSRMGGTRMPVDELDASLLLGAMRASGARHVGLLTVACRHCASMVAQELEDHFSRRTVPFCQVGVVASYSDMSAGHFWMQMESVRSMEGLGYRLFSADRARLPQGHIALSYIHESSSTGHAEQGLPCSQGSIEP